MIEITLNHPIQIPLSDENLKELRSIEPQRFFISEEPQEHDFSLMSFELSDSFNLFSTRQTVARKELIIRCLTSTARWIVSDDHSSISWDLSSSVREEEKESRLRTLITQNLSYLAESLPVSGVTKRFRSSDFFDPLYSVKEELVDTALEDLDLPKLPGKIHDWPAESRGIGCCYMTLCEPFIGKVRMEESDE